MEEDDDDVRFEIFPWALGKLWKKRITFLMQVKNHLYWTIDCRAVVSKKCCDRVSICIVLCAIRIFYLIAQK